MQTLPSTSLHFSDQDLYTLYAKTLEDQRAGVVIFEPVFDQDGKLSDLIWRHVSTRSAQDSGLSVKQMLNRPLLSLFPHVRHTRFWSSYEQVLLTGEAQDWEDHYVGEGLDNYLLTRVERYGERYLRVSYTLINDLKRAEQKATAAAEQLRQVIDGSISGMMACEAVRDFQGVIHDLRVVMVNQTASAINGRAVSYMQGKTLRVLFPSVVETGLLERYLHTARTGEVQRIESPYYHDQIEGWFDIAVSPLEGQGILLSFTDITQIKQLQVQQQRSILDLQQSNEGLESFARVASHDLKEPLRKIETFSSLLLEHYGPTLDTQGQDYLRRMQKATRRMSNLIGDLLTYARLSGQRLVWRKVALIEIMAHVLSDLEILVGTSGAVIEVDELPIIRGDATQLSQLFQNLLANAMHYRQADRSLTIQITSEWVGVTSLPAGLISVVEQTTLNPPAYWQISVTDNGIGFEERYLDRIFAVFQRLHGRNQYEGSGIGLSICKRVVENHHGAITARSQPNQGTTFLVYLPVDESLAD